MYQQLAGGGDWMNQAQQVQQMAKGFKAKCAVCEQCPEWISGALDPLLQWGRQLPGFDWWLIVSAMLGGSMLIIAFPPTRQIIKAVVEVIRTVWTKTSRNK